MHAHIRFRPLLAMLVGLTLGLTSFASGGRANEEEKKQKLGPGIGIGITIDITKLKKKKTPPTSTAKKKETAKPKPAAKKEASKPKPAVKKPAKEAGKTSRKKPVTVARSPNAPPAGETRYLRKEVLFVVRPGQPQDTPQAIALAFDISRIAEADLALIERRVHRYAIRDARSVAEVVTALEADPRIEIAQPNYLYELAQNAAGGQVPYSVTVLHLEEAHKLASGEGVVVAVVDSRIDAAHPALEGRIRSAFSATDLPPSAEEPSPHPHGTAMAGAIAASGTLMGTAPGATLLAVETFAPDEKGRMNGNSYNILRGVDWAAAEGAVIQNLSFAGPRDPLLSRLMKAGAAKGVIFVAAGGNAGPKSAPLYPAADESAIGTTAVDAAKRIYNKATRGDHLLVAAPGVDVMALAPGGRMALSTGTSIATAQVSGMLALALQIAGSMDRERVLQQLELASEKLPLPPRSARFGLLNAFELVESVNGAR